MDQTNTIRLPIHTLREINEILKARRQLAQRLGGDPSIKAIAETVNKSTETVAWLLDCYERANPSSLDYESDDEMMLLDMLADDRASPEEEIVNLSMQKQVAALLKNLTPQTTHCYQASFWYRRMQAINFGGNRRRFTGYS